MPATTIDLDVTWLDLHKTPLDFTDLHFMDRTCDIYADSHITATAGTLAPVEYLIGTETFRIPFDSEDFGNSAFQFQTCDYAERMTVSIEDELSLVYFDSTT